MTETLPPNTPQPDPAPKGEVTIEAVTHHGMGRTADGTLVPRVLPGEVVTIAADGPKIITPSPERVAPPCRHFKACGGCAMQHASDGFVEGWKAEIVRTALRAQGLDGDIAGVETSPADSRRRARLAGRRTKKGALVGFHARASDTVIEVPGCRLMLPALTALIPALERIAALAASRKGEAGLTVTDSEAGPDLHIDTDKPLTEELRLSLPEIAREAGLARLVWADEIVAELVPPVQRMGRARVVPPPGAFLQATAHGEAALLKCVRDAVAGADRIVDLFAGCGTFSLPLAERAEIHAVEGEAAMLAALDRGWRGAAGLKRVSTEARDLFRRPLLPDELKRFDAAVIDPPRAGAQAQVAALAASHIPVIAMVSCSPASFARDAKTLVEQGYDMGPITVVDQFRWSPHLELATRFTRR
ncbi:class I SAM-dependent RNA methyltransferase [Limimaricola hongkongensis]|uniref:23S rRNA (Uracil-5-)-methyltransferase RumA n=1 Tax=Limimaricola hongkongensis DSM 17492 TaxID=1122180 RepID=A0A017HHD7_9RHOB|nr:class I SAM-dependent RNA methyltransferase [Limimaricola hongkongensis]EYD73209.1 23S rRNA (Uracil-5-) -methyltransferase RumA [Limimaricola hongkongensis DSM 17492]